MMLLYLLAHTADEDALAFLIFGLGGLAFWVLILWVAFTTPKYDQDGNKIEEED